MTKRFISGPMRSLVIPEGIDWDKFADLPSKGSFRARYPETSGKTLILFLGRFDQKKGIELLVEAFSDVALRRADVHLLLVGGGDGDYVKVIMGMLEARGMTQRSTYAGMVSDEEKMAALSDSDIFVLPSRGENFGIAVVEAMACGLPVIISDQVGIRQEIADTDAGTITRCDAREIVVALGKYIDDPVLRRRHGMNGKELVRTHFSQDRMAEKMEKAFNQLVGERKAVT